MGEEKCFEVGADGKLKEVEAVPGDRRVIGTEEVVRVRLTRRERRRLARRGRTRTGGIRVPPFEDRVKFGYVIQRAWPFAYGATILEEPVTLVRFRVYAETNPSAFVTQEWVERRFDLYGRAAERRREIERRIGLTGDRFAVGFAEALMASERATEKP